jgi:hypothetical protein
MEQSLARAQGWLVRAGSRHGQEIALPDPVRRLKYGPDQPISPLGDPYPDRHILRPDGLPFDAGA